MDHLTLVDLSKRVNAAISLNNQIAAAKNTRNDLERRDTCIAVVRADGLWRPVYHLPEAVQHIALAEIDEQIAKLQQEMAEL